jgi:dihydropteroate synthase
MIWLVRGRELTIDHPFVMGIVNATPDSFSDGGRYADSDAAVAHAVELLDEGADIIDIGGESTRPGAMPVGVAEELARVVPVVAGIARARPDALISVDTVKSAVAREAIASGAHIVNDVSGLRLDPELPRLCAEHGVGLVIMHSRGTVSEMAGFDRATYSDVATDVMRELEAAMSVAEGAGVSRAAIAVDPGIGFSKRSRDSVEMLRAIPRLAAWGRPVLVGTSRKRFLGEITGVREPAGRLNGTLGANVGALALGARIFRVHDVREHREALDVAWELLREE